jgi:hypothetical protein
MDASSWLPHPEQKELQAEMSPDSSLIVDVNCDRNLMARNVQSAVSKR